MDIEALSNSPIGKLVPIQVPEKGRTVDYFAYVPDPPPTKFKLSTDTFRLVEEATLALGRLDGAANRLPNPRLLIRPSIWQEAISSAALEGTYTTLPSALQSELIQEERSPENREVLDYVHASEFAFNALENGQPLGINLLRAIHGRLVDHDPRCPSPEKGEIRSRQNFIGPRPDSPIREALYVPPPPGDQLLNALYEWEKWIHRQDVPRFVRLAIGHYQFEAIHPFFDGNGRLGRLIIILSMMHEGALTVPILVLSTYLLKRRSEYQQHLRDISITGDFEPWLLFFLEALRVKAESGIKKTARLQTLKDEMLAELRPSRRGLVITLAENLIGTPILAATRVRDEYQVTYPAALHALESLEEFGFVERIQWGTGRRNMFVANKVIEILENEEEEEDVFLNPNEREQPSEQSLVVAQK